MTRCEPSLRAWALAVLCAGCQGTQAVGTRYLKKVPVAASVGAIITVSAGESAELAGTQIEVPPGALLADTTITLELGLDPLAVAPDLVAGPVLMLGPEDAVLRSNLTVTLPLMPTGPPDPSGPGDIQLVISTARGGRGRVASPAVSADPGSQRVRAQLAALVSLQPIVRRCAGDAECAPGVCLGGRCQGPKCGATFCPLGELCCNDSCGTCAKPGQACPTTDTCAACSPSVQCPPGTDCLNQSCHPAGSVPCGNAICAAGTSCCDPTCGLCADAASSGTTSCGTLTCAPIKCANDPQACPPGLTCQNGVCAPSLVPCGQNLCADGMVCCNAACGLCTQPGVPCSQTACACDASSCGAPSTLPQCPCAGSNGTQQCTTGKCVTGPNGGCGWEIQNCM